MNRSLTAAATTISVATVALLSAGLAFGAAPAMAAESSTSAANSTSTTASDPEPTSRSTLPAIQRAGAAQTQRRIVALNTAISRVTANARLTDADKATLLASLNEDLTGMTALQAELAADTTASEAWTDYQSMYTEYRVYSVAIPQAHIAAAADGMTATAIPKLQTAHDELATALAGEHADDSTPELEAKLADMQTQIDLMTSSTDGLAARALAVTPADYNANHGVLADERAAVKVAVQAAKTAAQDARAIVVAIR